MLIDAKNTILGRLAAYAAKQALIGETIDIINCELAIVTGTKKKIIESYRERIHRGEPFHGPFFPRVPHMLVRRTCRGMIPYKTKKGTLAYKRIKCYKGTPEKFQNKESIKLSQNLSKLKILKYMTVKDICEDIKQ